MIATFEIYNWGSKRELVTDENLSLGDKYVVWNNFGQFIGRVAELKEESGKKRSSLQISGEEDSGNASCETDYLRIVRRATEKDIEKTKSFEKEEKKILEVCREKIKEFQLPMKLVGANHSLDGSSLIIAFTAESRVDFRELVRNLSHSFQKAVRLEQIGSRDEARCSGGFGLCGKELCCAKFNGPLKSINTDMARVQQITHRGSERISGCCGRLMCCLAYELKNYEGLAKEMPEMGETIETKDGQKGKVKKLKIIQKKMLVEFEGREQQEGKWMNIGDIKKIIGKKD